MCPTRKCFFFHNKSFDYFLILLRSQDIGPHSFFCVYFHQPQLCNMQKLAKIPTYLVFILNQ